ncbi:MAG: DUF2244 domain-containing protein [Burkholderiaceae bacterium]|nr:DUF2244 domain-containing protein [Burkholderiaceae bacterium]
MGYRWSYIVDSGRHQWLLKRNCALRPWQLAAWFFTVVFAALAIAVVCAAGGAWFVIPFAIVEAVAVAAAFVAYARHAADYERIEATNGRLVVESGSGSRIDRFEHGSRAVRVEYDGNAREPIRLVAGGVTIAIGRYVPDDRKAMLVQQLRGALGAGQWARSGG